MTHDLCAGDKFEMYYPLDDKFYPGSISEYEENTAKHKKANDIDQTENLDMKNETWRILKTNQVLIADITSISDEAFKEYIQTFQHREFILHQAQVLPLHPISNA